MVPRAVSLDLSVLSAVGQAAWLAYIRYAMEALGIPGTVTVDPRGLDPALCGQSRQGGAAAGRANILVQPCGEPNGDESFVFVSGSEVLSRKLLATFERIHIEPRNPPGAIDTHLYWAWRASREQFDSYRVREGERLDEQARAELSTLTDRLRPAARRVSLLSSVFMADEYLDGFLENAANLEGYGECEHFLIRPGSPGQEHGRLLAHVRAWPCAVYINLAKDPGLYEVWNLGARLSTAPYLTSANLDDRRAPGHVSRLAQILDGDAALAAVSTALRVTEQKNLPWERSAECPVWFGKEGDRVYGPVGLLHEDQGGLRARNLPHCMPLWRRSLHLFHGYFDEAVFGPSADWAFWLRVGERGGLFRLVSEPLGVYLKHTDSYWRREGRVPGFERRILDRYGYLAAGTAVPPPAESVPPPLAPEIEAARRYLEGMMNAEGLARLIRVGRRAGFRDDDTVGNLLDRLFELHLGCREWRGAVLREDLPPAADTRLEHFFEVLHGLVQKPEWAGAGGVRAQRALAAACADLLEMTGDNRWLFLRALTLRRLGAREEEASLWRALHDEDPCRFWEAFQSVYRFSVGLREVVSALARISHHRSTAAADLRAVTGRLPQRGIGGLMTPGEEDLRRLGDHEIVFFPAYSNNPYLELLYRPVIAAGGRARGVKDFRELARFAPIPGRRNVVHVHWINAVFRDVTPEGFRVRGEEFLEALRLARAKGFALYWTVHNRVSHQAVDRELEMEFRKALYETMDRVYVHHPLGVEALDWLPDRRKLHLVEHGAYDCGTPGDRIEARRRLGAGADDVVLVHIGQVRGYKGLEDTLPPLFQVLEREPRLRMVIAGRIVSPEVKAVLETAQSDRLLVKDAFISERELETNLHGADFGFLSYREILTSGSLFHLLSCGVPVIAPALGTIPAYVVPGWNGYLYRSPEELAEVAKQCLNLSLEQRERMAQNARKTATSLDWTFF